MFWPPEAETCRLIIKIPYISCNKLFSNSCLVFNLNYYKLFVLDVHTLLFSILMIPFSFPSFISVWCKMLQNIFHCCLCRLAQGSGKHKVRTERKSESCDAKWIWHSTPSVIIKYSFIREIRTGREPERRIAVVTERGILSRLSLDVEPFLKKEECRKL